MLKMDHGSPHLGLWMIGLPAVGSGLELGRSFLVSATSNVPMGLSDGVCGLSKSIPVVRLLGTSYLLLLEQRFRAVSSWDSLDRATVRIQIGRAVHAQCKSIGS